MNAPSLSPVLVSIDKLNLDPANARKHSERNLQAIATSLSMFGQRRPVVVQKQGMIVRAGNGLLQAAKSLGWTEVVALVCDDDNATAAQFAIADNRTAELAEWDTETLATLLDGMEEQTRDALGFDAEEMDAMLAKLTPPESSASEVDVEEFDLECKCPRCGFEYNSKA